MFVYIRKSILYSILIAEFACEFNFWPVYTFRLCEISHNAGVIVVIVDTDPQTPPKNNSFHNYDGRVASMLTSVLVWPRDLPSRIWLHCIHPTEHENLRALNTVRDAKGQRPQRWWLRYCCGQNEPLRLAIQLCKSPVPLLMWQINLSPPAPLFFTPLWEGPARCKCTGEPRVLSASLTGALMSTKCHIQGSNLSWNRVYATVFRSFVARCGCIRGLQWSLQFRGVRGWKWIICSTFLLSHSSQIGVIGYRKPFEGPPLLPFGDTKEPIVKKQTAFDITCQTLCSKECEMLRVDCHSELV